MVIIDNLRVAGAHRRRRPIAGATPTDDDLRGAVRRRARRSTPSSSGFAVTALCHRLRSTERAGRRGRSSIGATNSLADVERIQGIHPSPATAFRLCSRGGSSDADFVGSLYRALRALNPSPYMYHLVLDGMEIVGSSPELLVTRCRQSRHGAPHRRNTAARCNAGEDEGSTAELLADERSGPST